jgi:hypothetical protein
MNLVMDDFDGWIINTEGKNGNNGKVIKIGSNK